MCINDHFIRFLDYRRAQIKYIIIGFYMLQSDEEKKRNPFMSVERNDLFIITITLIYY